MFDSDEETPEAALTKATFLVSKLESRLGLGIIIQKLTEAQMWLALYRGHHKKKDGNHDNGNQTD